MLFQLYVGNNGGTKPSADYRGLLLAWYPEQIIVRDCTKEQSDEPIKSFPIGYMNTNVACFVIQHVYCLNSRDEVLCCRRQEAMDLTATIEAMAKLHKHC